MVWIGGVMDLVLFRTNENRLEPTKAEVNMAMPQIAGKKIEQKAKNIHAKKSEYIEAPRKHEQEDPRRHP